MHDRQVHLQAVERGATGVDLQHAALHERGKVQLDRRHVAHDLVRAFLEREIKTALVALATGGGHVRRDAAFARAGGAGDEHAASAIDAAAEHRIQSRNAAGDALAAGLVIQSDRSDRQNGDAVFVDQERILIRPMRRAAILHHAQPPRRNLVVQPMIEQDDAVGNVFFQPLARERPAALLAGDDGRHPLFFEPVKQPPHFRPQNGLVIQAGKQAFDGIEHHALRADLLDRVIQSNEKTFKVIFPVLVDLLPIDFHIIDRNLLPADQVFQIEPERGDVLLDVLFGFLKRHEHAGLIELDGAADEEFGRHQRLTTSRPAADQCRSASWQSTVGHFVQTFDAGGYLLQPARFQGNGLGHSRTNSSVVDGTWGSAPRPDYMVKCEAEQQFPRIGRGSFREFIFRFSPVACGGLGSRATWLNRAGKLTHDSRIGHVNCGAVCSFWRN